MANETRRENNAQATTRESGSALTRLDTSSQAQATSRDDQRAPVEGVRVVVPQSLRDRFQIQKQLPAQGAEAEILLADDLQHQRRVVIKLYRQGIEPKSEVLAKIAEMAVEHVVQLYEHGQADGVWYEVMEYAQFGSLRDLIKKPISPEQAKCILQELHSALNELHQHQIIHRDLKPENVLVREQWPLDLILTDFGIASVNIATQHLTSTSRTAKYAAPEAASGVLSAKADWWSLGIILLEVLTGKTPFDGMSDAVITKHLMTHPLIPEGVADPRWQQLLLGLLNRNDRVRWGSEEISRWLVGESVTVSKDQESIFISPSQVQTNSHYRPYVFVGENYATPKALAAGLVQYWDDAVKHLSRDLILQWFKEEIKDQDMISFLMDLKEESKLSADIKLLRLVQRLDPSLPPIWKGLDVSLDGILALAHAAQNDAKKREWLWEFRRDALSVFQDVQHKTLIQQINQGEKEFNKVWKKIELIRDDNTSLKPEKDSLLPQLILAIRSDELVAILRKQFDIASQCTWFSDIGKIETASVPALLAMRVVAKDAEDWVNKEQSRIRQKLKGNKKIGIISKECPWFIALGDIETADYPTLKQMESRIEEASKWCDLKQRITQEIQDIRNSLAQEESAEFTKLFPWFMELTAEKTDSENQQGLIAITQQLELVKQWKAEQARLRRLEEKKRNEELAKWKAEKDRLVAIGCLKYKCSETVVCKQHDLEVPCNVCNENGVEQYFCKKCQHHISYQADKLEHICYSIKIYLNSGELFFEIDANLEKKYFEAIEQEKIRQRKENEQSRIRKKLNRNKRIDIISKECPWFIALGDIATADLPTLMQMDSRIEEASNWCDLKQKITQEIQDISNSLAQEEAAEFTKLFPWFMELTIENIDSQNLNGLIALRQKINDIKTWVVEQERYRQIIEKEKIRLNKENETEKSQTITNNSVHSDRNIDNSVLVTLVLVFILFGLYYFFSQNIIPNSKVIDDRARSAEAEIVTESTRPVPADINENSLLKNDSQPLLLPVEPLSENVTPLVPVETRPKDIQSSTNYLDSLNKVNSVELINNMIDASIQNNESAIETSKQKIIAFEKPKRGNRKLARKLNDQGLSFSALNNFEDAIPVLEQAANADPSDAEILNNLGYVFYKNGDYEKAFAVLNATVLLNPQRSNAWSLLGFLYATTNDLPKSIACFSNAYRMSKNPIKTHDFFLKSLSEEPNPSIKSALESVTSDWAFKVQPEKKSDSGQEEIGRANNDASVVQSTDKTNQDLTNQQVSLDELVWSAESLIKQRNYEKALPLLKEAGKRGSHAAQETLFEMYLIGNGVFKNSEQAAYWVTKSANDGKAKAQYYLGLIYQTGDGVTRDPSEAIFWLKKATEQGFPRAEKMLKFLARKGPNFRAIGVTHLETLMDTDYDDIVYKESR